MDSLLEKSDKTQERGLFGSAADWIPYYLTWVPCWESCSDPLIALSNAPFYFRTEITALGANTS